MSGAEEVLYIRSPVLMFLHMFLYQLHMLNGIANPTAHTENRQNINSLQQKQPVQEDCMQGQSFLESQSISQSGIFLPLK